MLFCVRDVICCDVRVVFDLHIVNWWSAHIYVLTFNHYLQLPSQVERNPLKTKNQNETITRKTTIATTMKFRHTESLPSLAHLDETSSDDDNTASTSTPRPYRHAESTACLHDLDDDSTSSGKAVVPPHRGWKKVLVTGGAGFVGSNVAEALLERGDSVVIVDEMNDYYDVRIKENNLKRLRELCPDGERLTIYRGDICDEEFMLDLFEREQPKWVCHMAARAGVRPSIQDPYVYIHSNIRGTTHLMELSHRFGVKVSSLCCWCIAFMQILFVHIS